MIRGMCAIARRTDQTGQAAGTLNSVRLDPPSAGPWTHPQSGGGWHVLGRRVLLVATLMCVWLPLPDRPAAAADAANPHFPKPLALQAQVRFWKQIYSEYGVADFVLH